MISLFSALNNEISSQYRDYMFLPENTSLKANVFTYLKRVKDEKKD